MTKPTETMASSIDPKLTPQARGKRVETLRRMTRLSRRAFEEKYGIPKSSLQSWEDAFNSGLTEKGAKRLLTALKPAGIICSTEWLMFGIGPGPQVTENLFANENDLASQIEISSPSKETEASAIAEELLAFHKHYPRAGIDYVVIDDGMEPRFIKGEHVAGCKHFGKDIEQLIGMDCIVQTAEGEILLRTIKKQDTKDHYTLVCSNPNTTVEKPTLYSVEILSAAPVIWTRRKNITT